ncbi:MAG: 6-phosphogluconolactonase [Anaerolineae bacterium]|nr:6-phosphogluconolactonase [Anaerolineae bacterium]
MEFEMIVVPDAEALARSGAQRFVRSAQQAIGSRGRFTAALSGGSTPRALYRLLSEEPFRSELPWEQVHLFWGDERCVPAGDPGSNYRMAEETLISRVPIPPGNVHRVRGELPPEQAARAYARDLEEFFCGPRTRFDLVLLGLGSDGHTASLFPESPVLEETTRLAATVEADYEDRPACRITLTLPAINTSRQILFLVSGDSKAEIVRQVLSEPGGPLPAQQVRPTAGQLTWLIDEAAANRLEEDGPKRWNTSRMGTSNL